MQQKVKLFVASKSACKINILKLIIGLTIFRRWRTVHGTEERPSPSGFAMVFQKVPLNIKSLRNKNDVKNPSTSLWSVGLNSSNSKDSTDSSSRRNDLLDTNRMCSTSLDLKTSQTTDKNGATASPPSNMVIILNV